MQKKKGFTLVELMVVVAIIAILAAVSLPMYTRFQQRTRASNPYKGATGWTTAVQAFYINNGQFANPSIDATAGWILIDNPEGDTINTGVSVPPIENIAWTITLVQPGDGTDTNAGVLDIRAVWDAANTRCPDSICNYRFCVACTPAKCWTQLDKVAGADDLELNELQVAGHPACDGTPIPGRDN